MLWFPCKKGFLDAKIFLKWIWEEEYLFPQRLEQYLWIVSWLTFSHKIFPKVTLSSNMWLRCQLFMLIYSNKLSPLLFGKTFHYPNEIYLSTIFGKSQYMLGNSWHFPIILLGFPCVPRTLQLRWVKDLNVWAWMAPKVTVCMNYCAKSAYFSHEKFQDNYCGYWLIWLTLPG